jgi:Flp pilus assembly protein TadD
LQNRSPYFRPRLSSARTIVAVLIAFVLVCSASLTAKDIRISIPKRTKPTKVQKYNQDGVKALKKQKISSAKKEFYKAYLLDPNDPFTLNNLGYISELEGDLEKAQRYYDLASANLSEAIVEKSTSESAEGQPVSKVAGRSDTGPLQVNRLNVEAINLLQKDRAIEAEGVLLKALDLDPNNAFTLNNLGFAREKQGELESALSYYVRAANTNSEDSVIIAPNKDWRGRSISTIAANNVTTVRELLQNEQSVEARVARLNLRGVSALNKNNRVAARGYFQQAIKLDPNNAFSLNNMGYVAELDNDRESANYFYAKAKNAEGNDASIGMATRRAAEGRPLGAVADRNETIVSEQMERDLLAKRRNRAPVQLKNRDEAPPSHTNRQPY